MAFNFSSGHGGDIQDPQILSLLSQLTPLVKKHGANGEATLAFIEKHANVIGVCANSQRMYTFKEVATPLSLLIQGFSLDQPKEKDPADYWKNDE